jgi:predicted metalloprotease with PDZ domain
VKSIAAHEFFHIVTPLNIHSELIEDYDFNEPRQSKHLWLYEGMTEYATMHMPVRQGLESVDDFLRRVDEKIAASAQFDPQLSLTALSENAVARQDQYYNVYLKGALAGLCLDVRLRAWSGGEYGTQQLLRDLAERYGAGAPFSEAGLFDEIAQMTEPGVRDFFLRYVEGTEPLPLEEVFALTGLRREKGKLRVDPRATEKQVRLRQAWLGR